MYIGRLSLLAAICCAFAPAQTISSLQSSTQANFPNAANITTIDGGIPSLPNGFLLYVNGAFSIGQNPTVVWTNQNPLSANQSGTLSNFTLATPTQLVVVVPFSFFSNSVLTPETVFVTVKQGASTSPPTTFTIVPLPSTTGSPLPPATFGVPYSSQLVFDGSPPYDTSMLGGFPPGLGMNAAGNTVTGTATGSTGVFSVTGFVIDFWGIVVDLGTSIQVIGPPVFGVFISSAGINYPYGTVTNLTMPIGPVPPVPAFSSNIVQFFDNNTLLGTVSVGATGLAQLNGVFLAAGVHNNLKVAFLGDANWAAANVGPFTITVTQAGTKPAITSPIAATYGGPLSASTLTMNGAGGQAVAPTGSVTISVGSATITTFSNINPGGVATPLTLTGLQLPASVGTGTQALTYTYSGDTNYTAISGTATLVVNRAQPTATLGVSANPIAVGQTETFTATLRAPGIGTPTGTVAFTDGATPLGAASLNAAGIATLSTSALTLGQHSIGYSYLGDNNFSGAQPSTTTVNVNSLSLSIPTAFLPGGVLFQPYGGATIVVTGGVPPYTIIASGLPSGLSINAQTGAITGSPGAAGTFSPTFTATDSQNSKVSTTLSLTIALPPVRISTPSTLPDGTVGVGYSATIGTLGGTSPITFSFTGNPPPGLSFIGPLVTGTPTTAGTFSFTVRASDAANTSDTQDFTLTIKPPPLSIPGGPTNPTGTSGTLFTVDFGCTGGVPPYKVTTTGTLPPGTALTNCTLSGTPTTPGTYPIHIVVTDSKGTTATRDAVITIAPPTLALAGGNLGNGQVGVPYTGKIGATGGVQPYSFSGSGLPDGLSLSSAGDITGTPTTAGQFSFRVTVKDSSVTTAPVTASATYSITILPPTLAFGQATLPDGVVGVAYSGSLTATGGVKPYRFSGSGLPDGLTLNSDGTITGTPTAAATFTLTASVTDAANGATRQTYSIKIAPPPLTIPTASAVNGTVGTAYSMTFSAAGGTQPYSFSASGQPSTLTMSAGGTLSGTPTAPGSFTVAVTVKDANGTTATKSFPITIVLPASPPLNFGGISTTVGSAQQPRVSVSLGSVYPVDVLVTLTLVLTPDSGPVDPNVVFSTGGTTTTITIPAGSLNGATDVGFQTGTVAGTITITAKLTAAGVDVTPSTAPRSTTRIAAAAPVIVSATGTRTSTGFTITAIGYVTDREMTTAVFGFSGSNLGTTSLTVTADTLFAGWLSGAQPPSAAFGSQFTYTQPFTVSGTNSNITTVTLTLNNKVGASNTVTVTLQ